MAFRIDTNIAALRAEAALKETNWKLNKTLEELSTGLRINSAADDASGLQIADSLRNQADSLGQAIRNANDGIAIMQIADKAMGEQENILNTIKVKATEAAQAGQTTNTRKALQDDITKLMDELDNIAQTTTYNGKHLLNGAFTNQKFQIGAYSHQTVTASIQSTMSNKIGNTTFETGKRITASGLVQLTFKDVDGSHDVKLQSVKISTSAGTGIGALANVINQNSQKLGVKASWQVLTTGSHAVESGSIQGLKINGVTIGDINNIQANDSTGALVAAINAVSDQTGVEAYIDNRGNINLRSVDGRGIVVSAQSGLSILGISGEAVNYGRLTLTRLDGRDIIVSGSTGNLAGLSSAAKATINLADVRKGFTADQASAIGMWANSEVADYGEKVSEGVTTLKGAMAVMDIADSAAKLLDQIRAGIGSVENQLQSTVSNLTTTQVNVKAAESQIRDVDFAAATAEYQKYNILAQSGSYALAQANASQQIVLKLLQ